MWYLLIYGYDLFCKSESLYLYDQIILTVFFPRMLSWARLECDVTLWFDIFCDEDFMILSGAVRSDLNQLGTWHDVMCDNMMWCFTKTLNN